MRKLYTAKPTPQEAPQLIIAARVLTQDAHNSCASALLVQQGIIRAVGGVDDCLAAAAALGTPEPEVHDFSEHTIVPGFIDAHAHPLMLGQLMTWVDCSPARAASIPEIVELLRQAAAKLPPGQPVRGYGYEQQNLAERRHPTRHELDAVACDREVYLMNASGHGGVVNSYTLTKYGITRESEDPPGGSFFRDAAGELTGELSDAACNVLTGADGVKIGQHGPNFHLPDSPAEHLEQLDLAQREFLAGGVTTVGDAQVSSREFQSWLSFAESARMHIRCSMYLLSHLLDAVLGMGMTAPFGDARLSFAGIKLYADGTLGGCTAYFPEGYANDPHRTGQLYHSPEEYAEMVMRAHAAGLQTATHAQSPDAIELVIAAVEAAQQAHPERSQRHRIEHCGLPTPAQITRIERAGIYPVNQPQHHFNWGEGVVRGIGEIGERFNPLGEMQRAGVPVTISSDAPVADPLPLEAIQAAASRTTRRGAQLGAKELAITVSEALKAHTINAARALGREGDLGSLEVGKRADFAVLEANPLTTPVPEISEIRVLATWIGGKQAYTRINGHSSAGAA